MEGGVRGGGKKHNIGAERAFIKMSLHSDLTSSRPLDLVERIMGNLLTFECLMHVLLTWVWSARRVLSA